MAEIEDYLGNTDKVTQYLKARTPDFSDISQAALSAVNRNWGGQPTTFGEQLNLIQANQIKQADSILDNVRQQDAIEQRAAAAQSRAEAAAKMQEMAMLRHQDKMELGGAQLDLKRALIEAQIEKMKAAQAGGDKAADWVMTTQIDPQNPMAAPQRVLVNKLTGQTRPVLIGGQPMYGAHDNSGISVETGPAGTSVRTGAAASMPIAKGAMTGISKDAVALRERLARVSRAVNMFKPEWLTTRGQVGAGITAFDDRVIRPFTGGYGIMGPENRKDLLEYSAFKSTVTNDLNQVVHDLSGAAVTTQEAERLKQAIASMEDGPLQFIGKMQGVLQDMTDRNEIYKSALSKGQLPTELANGSPEAYEARQQIMTMIDGMLHKVQMANGGKQPQQTPDAPGRVKIDLDGNRVQ